MHPDMDSDTGGDFDGAKAALFCGDRLVCLLRDDRPDIPFPAMWDFPGGGREMGETPWQTLVREVAEEIGLTIHERHVHWHIVDDSASAPGRVIHFYVLHLPAGAERGILFGDEGQAYVLMTPERFLGLPDAVPSLQRRLRRWMDETDAGR